MIAGPDICRVIAGARASLACEKDTQADLDAALVAAFGESVQRERRLSPRDIPDFMIDGVAVEVKVRGAQKRAIMRQLERYAEHDEVTALVLATSLSMGLPPAINGKPAYYVSLSRGWV